VTYDSIDDEPFVGAGSINLNQLVCRVKRISAANPDQRRTCVAKDIEEVVFHTEPPEGTPVEHLGAQVSRLFSHRDAYEEGH
jgi:hypothetical protein